MTTSLVRVAPSSSSSARARTASLAEVARVDPDAAQARASHLDCGPDPLVDVVRVDQQRRARPEGGHLRRKGLFFARVSKHESVRRRTRRRYAVAAARLEVRGAGETRQG